MFYQTDAGQQEVRARQQELLEWAERARLLARARRDATQSGPESARRRGWLARRVRADLARS